MVENDLIKILPCFAMPKQPQRKLFCFLLFIFELIKFNKNNFNWDGLSVLPAGTWRLHFHGLWILQMIRTLFYVSWVQIYCNSMNFYLWVSRLHENIAVANIFFENPQTHV